MGPAGPAASLPRALAGELAARREECAAQVCKWARHSARPLVQAELFALARPVAAGFSLWAANAVLCNDTRQRAPRPLFLAHLCSIDRTTSLIGLDEARAAEEMHLVTTGDRVLENIEANRADELIYYILVAINEDVAAEAHSREGRRDGRE